MFGVVKNVNWKTSIRNYSVERLVYVKKLFKAEKSVQVGELVWKISVMSRNILLEIS